MSLAAGVHDLSAEEYHADPCPEPSLSSSGIKRLLTGSPAEFAAHNPKLSQFPELIKRDGTKAQDLGTIVHSIVLGKGAGFHALDPEDCPARTKKGAPYTSWRDDAKAWREEQEAKGVIIMSRPDGARVQTAAGAMVGMLRKEYGDWPIGDSEVAILWQRETAHGPIWCRALLDHVALRHMTVLDPKSTDWPISDRIARKKVSTELWAIQSAWYMEAVESAHPEIVGRLRFRFPLVEINPPFQTRFVTMSEARISIARQRIDRAADLFAKCLRDGVWPPYAQDYEPELESWELSEFEAEELSNV